MEQLGDIIQQIVNPVRDDADAILEDIGLATVPSTQAVYDEIEQKLLSPPDILPEHWLPIYQVHWKHDIHIPSLLSLPPAPPPTSLQFVRAGLDGHVTGYVEVPNPRVATALTSSSMDRAPAPPAAFVRGKSSYVPFKPGGLDDVFLSSKTEHLNERGLRTVAPGLSRGLRLPGDEVEDDSLAALEDSLPSKAAVGDLGKALLAGDEQRFDSGLSQDGRITEVDELLPADRSLLRPTKTGRVKRTKVVKRDWAHEVDMRKPMTNFHKLVPVMAHKYPFELDTFQKEAVYHIEMGDSVFVAAHTSAGKTVVAEYAIALAEKHMTRAIYTSPIKALSNQKFRDFKQTFGASSVGILTGDVQINPEANCLVMTTEILRSMLYKGADLIRDVEFVIFDEVHYVNDAERGVVWEEVIIMLPDHVSIILLSATVPNTKEFADWVGRTKKKDIYVISTAQRPVPLEFYIYAGRDMFKIVDAKRKWLPEGYKEASEALKRKQDKEREAAGLPPQRGGARGAAQRGQRGPAGGRGNHRGFSPSGSAARGRGAGGPSRTIHTGADKNLYVHLVNHLQKKGLLPVVVFTLSKKKCEENANTLSNADLCTSVEKSEVHVTMEKALSRLKGSDKKLPQIAKMRSLLSRGIGVHHGGLLPIVKEVVELLFSRGLVKVLFATETFAMGVNMPAKCVVFSNTRKHDGRSFRQILPGECTQMAGRAGRRGLDTTGTVIIVAGNELPEQGELNSMILGTPAKLQSQFRLTYNMILNLLRVETLRVEEMIKRSFSENTSQRQLPENQKKIMEHERMLSSLPALECDICLKDIETYYDSSQAIVSRNNELLEMVVKHPSNQSILNSGRVVILRDQHFYPFSIAVLLKPDLRDRSTEKKFFVLAVVDKGSKSRKFDAEEDVPPRWCPNALSLVVENATYRLESVPISSISLVTNKTIKVDASKIIESHRKPPMLEAVTLLQCVVQEWLHSGVIQEVQWGRMRLLDFQEALRERDEILRSIKRASCILCENFEDHYLILHGTKVLAKSIADLKAEISEQNLELIPDYEQRIAVLKELNFIDENSTVQLKGRVACEINSANELILTELILENTLGNYEPAEVVALLSCFIFQEKTDVEPLIPPKLSEGLEAITAIAERVLRVQEHYQVPVEEFKSGLKVGLVEVVYEWAKGMPFDQIMALTDVPEGTIVRVITRLDETCREVRDAARVIGDAELFKKMEEAQIKIKRDIVFAASLYF
ncbi:ATP-dependent RNA helicase [Pisolithus microcarpus]|nr:ATP-dependent RNA helicase [Pisolithus microcarpus]